MRVDNQPISVAVNTVAQPTAFHGSHSCRQSSRKQRSGEPEGELCSSLPRLISSGLRLGDSSVDSLLGFCLRQARARGDKLRDPCPIGRSKIGPWCKAPTKDARGFTGCGLESWLICGIHRLIAPKQRIHQIGVAIRHGSRIRCDALYDAGGDQAGSGCQYCGRDYRGKGPGDHTVSGIAKVYFVSVNADPSGPQPETRETRRFPRACLASWLEAACPRIATTLAF